MELRNGMWINLGLSSFSTVVGIRVTRPEKPRLTHCFLFFFAAWGNAIYGSYSLAMRQILIWGALFFCLSYKSLLTFTQSRKQKYRSSRMRKQEHALYIIDTMEKRGKYPSDEARIWFFRKTLQLSLCVIYVIYKSKTTRNGAWFTTRRRRWASCDTNIVFYI